MKERQPIDPVLVLAKNVVILEIKFRMEMAIKQRDYLRDHESTCRCHHCRLEYERIKQEVEAEARDWIQMLQGKPTEADKLKPDWTKKHPPKPKRTYHPYEPPASP